MQRLIAVLLAVGLTLTGTALAQTTPAAPSAQPAQDDTSVAILVVDDFGEYEGEVEDDDETCVLSPQEQGFAIRGAGVDDDTTSATEMTHGEIVVQEIEETLEALDAEDNVTLVEVQIPGPDEAALIEAIQDAIDDSEADYFIINMSFAFVPCEFMEAMREFGGEFLSAREAKDLNRYRGIFQRAVVFYDNQVFPAMSQHFQEAEDLHPLQDIFVDQTNVIGIAAAGNFGLDFPFWPAAFGQILSVSASNDAGFEAPHPWEERGPDQDEPLLSIEGQGNQTDRLSNYGEVMIPGEYDVNEFEAVLGTSFAAPRLSALVAVYVADVGGDYCANDDGYLALITTDFDNLTLSEAIDEHCPALDDYLPEE